MTRARWIVLTVFLGFVALSVGYALDPSVATFPKWRLAGGTAGMLTEVTSTNQVMVTLTGTAAAQADSHEPSVATMPKMRIAGGTSGNLAEVDSTGHLLVTGVSTAIADADYGDITVSGSSAIWTIDADVVTYAKMQNVSANSVLLGAGSAGVGINPVEITVGSGLTMTGTTLTSAGVSGGAANKLAYWTGATTLSNNTLLHYDATNNNIGIGPVTFGTDLTNGLAFKHNDANYPSTNITDTVQLYARDQAGNTNSSLFVKAEAGGITSVGDRLISGNGGVLLSNGIAIGGIQLDGAGALIQLSNIAGVAHGITGAGVATSTFFDIRPVDNSAGGAQMRGVTELNLGMILSSITTTDPVSTKSTTSDAAMRIEFGKKFISNPEPMGAGVNLIAVSDVFGGLGTRWILDNDGDTWQTGHALQLRGVEANTAVLASPNLLAAADESNKVLTNEGIAAKNYHTLPTAATGLQYTFVVQDADGLRITANTADTVRIAAAVSAAAGYCESTTIGDSVTVVAINAVEWMAIAVVGAGWACT